MVALAVFIGGGLGAVARYGVGTWVKATAPASVFPWATFLVNVVGCLLLGVLSVVLTSRFPDAPSLRAFITTGFLGGLTTFSTFGVATMHLFDTGHAKLGLLYLAGNVGLGLLAAAAGMALGARLA